MRFCHGCGVSRAGLPQQFAANAQQLRQIPPVRGGVAARQRDVHVLQAKRGFAGQTQGARQFTGQEAIPRQNPGVAGMRQFGAQPIETRADIALPDHYRRVKGTRPCLPEIKPVPA